MAVPTKVEALEALRNLLDDARGQLGDPHTHRHSEEDLRSFIEAQPEAVGEQIMARPYFAIRHKPTGGFMCLKPGVRSGTNSIISAKLSPRIFWRRSHAADALGWWVLGVYSSWYDSEGDFHESHFPKADRVKDDWEIVPVLLSVGLAI